MSTATEAALREALDDEYKARATYQAVIATFGPVRPFTNIVASEGRHIEALLAQFERLGWAAPPDPWTGKVEAPDSVEAACRTAAEAEVDNHAMYERLIDAVDDPRIITVFRRLQAASQDNHLPAFRRCAERESGGDGEHRRRRRHRGGRIRD